MAGLARAAFGPLVLGAKMAPMEKLRDGRSTPILGGCLSLEICNNQPNDGVGGGEGVGEAMRMGGTRWGGYMCTHRFGRQLERQIKNLERAKGPCDSMAPVA